MSLSVGNKLEVLKEDVAEKANLPKHALDVRFLFTVIHPIPPFTPRLHFPVSFASRYGHVTTGDHW